MRRSDWLAGIVAVLAGGMAASVGACVFSFDTERCEDYPKVGCPGVGTTTVSTTTSGAGGTGTGGTGTGGTTTTTPTVDCDGDPMPVVGDVGNIRDECAVFVKSGATGVGSMGSPVGKVADAVGKLGGKSRIYVCTPAGMPLQEAVTLATANVEVYGGFDCSAADWTWSEAGRSDVEGPADMVAWTITDKANGSLVSGFKIKAASPSNMMGGGDSIGMAVADVVATIKRCDVEASDAASGTDGATPTDPVTDGQNAPMVTPALANACGNPGGIQGGPQGVTMCDGVDASGGPGGKGGLLTVNNGDGADGVDGVPAPSSGTSGKGGTGQTDLMMPQQFCTDGAKGQAGGTGTKGSAGQALGSLTLTGLTNGNGSDGGPGTPGQGGGGGGGSKAGMFCPGPSDGNGASGGGGGAGGCGGKGGLGGKSGGSSIAMLSLGTKLSIDGMTVTLKAGKGGAGGKGGIGQSGGGFGTGVVGGAASGMSPSKAGCKGGDGGAGGDGGPGGGGRGGHSIGIVFPKAAPGSLMFMMAPAVGSFGNGGTSAGGNAGLNGQAGAVCDFSKAANPCM